MTNEETLAMRQSKRRKQPQEFAALSPLSPYAWWLVDVVVVIVVVVVVGEMAL